MSLENLQLPKKMFIESSVKPIRQLLWDANLHERVHS